MHSTTVPVPKLWHTGQAIVDIVMTIDELPTPGGDAIARSTSYEAGGGFNVMAAARRYGMPVVYVGKHGTGPMGDRVRDALVSEDIVLASEADPDGDNGFCVALIDEQGERTFISQVGVEGRVDEKTLGALSPAPADWVYISGYSLAYPDKADPLLDWLDTLDEAVSVVFDPGPLVTRIDRSPLQRLLPRITLWSSNADETRRWTGLADLSEGVASIAARLGESATVIVRDGPRGCWSRRLGKTRSVAGFATMAVDTNGAGDAHTGVLIAALTEGSSLPDACRRANAAAAMAVSRRGPATAAKREELERYLAEAVDPSGD